jgi:hypothetical protein
MANTSLFKRLERLFSSDTVIRNVGGSQLKAVDINQIESAGKYQTNSLMDRFSRLYTYSTAANNIINPSLNYQTLRLQLYQDYEAMDTDPILATTLDVLADEATLKNDQGDMISIRSSDENIQRVLSNLFYDVLNVEFNLWSWIRNMCKYGDFFLKLEIAEEFGVYRVIPYTVYNMIRKENTDPDNPSKVIFELDPDGLSAMNDQSYSPNPKKKRTLEFDNYEIAHFRLISDTHYLPYGRSYIEPARKVYKQLTLMEDAMLIHRIMRAPEKRMFYINVGQIAPNEVEGFMQKTINQMKKTPYVDPKTGQYNLSFNIQNMMEDFYIPVRGGDTSTRIDTTKGMEYDGTADIEYLRSKLFAALKVPKAYFGFEEDLQGKATLAAEDIRFARTVERIQRIVESELTKIALVHLYTQGFTGESLTNFDLTLTTPSIVFEQEKVALMKEKIDLAAQMQDTKLFSSDYIYDKIFNLSEDTYMEQRELIREDSKRLFRVSQIETEGNDPAKSGMSYGTPHDLASMYGRRSTSTPKGAGPGEVPPGYEDNSPIKYNKPGEEGGRPREKFSIYGTQKDPLGADRLGTHDMKGGYPSDMAESISNLKTKSIFLQNKEYFQNLTKKKLIYEEDNVEESSNLLNESQIKDLDS